MHLIGSASKAGALAAEVLTGKHLSEWLLGAVSRPSGGSSGGLALEPENIAAASQLSG